MPFIALGVIVALLVGVVLWLNEARKPQPQPVAAPEVRSALADTVAPPPAEDPEKVRMNEELKKIKDALAASELKDRERSEQEFDAARAQVVARRQADLDRLRDHLTSNFFAGDEKAVDAFLKVQEDVIWAASKLMSDGDPSNDLKSKEEFENFAAERLRYWFQKNPELSQWLKDHKQEPREFIKNLMAARPGGASGNNFDFEKYVGCGSGFWISSDGWLVTNHHVVANAKVVDLRLRDGNVVQAEVMKTDIAADLALLKADHAPRSWHAVSKGDSELELGRTVFTVGYPDPMLQGVEPKFTDGRISAASGLGDRKDSYQTTVPVQHGNSGGALVDFASGWVVGVINAKLMSSNGASADNVSYAIKCNVLSGLIESVPEAKSAALKVKAKAPTKGNEREVIDHATDSSVLLLRPR